MQKINNIKDAIYSELKGNAALTALITGVYNIDVPDGTAMPYVTYFIVTQRSDDDFSNTVDLPLFQVDCYAQKTATKSAGQLVGEVAQAVAAALDDVTLTIVGYTCVCCNRESTRELYEPEIEARRISIDYRALITQPK